MEPEILIGKQRRMFKKEKKKGKAGEKRKLKDK